MTDFLDLRYRRGFFQLCDIRSWRISGAPRAMIADQTFQQIADPVLQYGGRQPDRVASTLEFREARCSRKSITGRAATVSEVALGSVELTLKVR
jgi:hypothetical protein